MSTLVINYRFNNLQLANPNNTAPTTATGCIVVPGPGPTALGELPKALDFGITGRVKVNLPLAELGAKKFCVRTIIRVDTPLAERQYLVGSEALPFSIHLDRIEGSADFEVIVATKPRAHGWVGARTESRLALKVGAWYLVDLIYDTDTLGVAIDGDVVAVVAFPEGAIELGGAPALFIGLDAVPVLGKAPSSGGGGSDGAPKGHFSGQMAALQLHNGIPAELEARLDERRDSPEWFITFKYQEVRPQLGNALGAVKGGISYDAGIGAHTQLFSRGVIIYSEGLGAAFEMHGAIFQAYQALADRAALGYLASDETDANAAGSRKCMFSKGAIYWSLGTGAVPVVGQIHVDYAMMGDAGFLGLPVAAATAVPGGCQQVFRGGRMFHKAGEPSAHAVQGAILEKFLATGGLQTWGYPISNEGEVRHDSAELGKCSEFEHCTIYWRSGVGAFEVHGAIRDRYRALGGPLGRLGFPTSDEQPLPGTPAPARGNSFQGGSILWFGPEGIFVADPFNVFIKRLNTREYEGATMGQNDPYFYVTVADRGHELANARFPASTHSYKNKNVVEISESLPQLFVPNRLDLSLEVQFDVWEYDNVAGGDDDHLGTHGHTLDAGNAWGMRKSQGVLDTGPFSHVKSLTWAVQPVVTGPLTAAERWWGTANRETAKIDYQTYAEAFWNVDSVPERWDLTDAMDKLYYRLAISGLAAKGNCFGMSLEAIYALKHRSLLSLPLNRFTEWDDVEHTFNVRHQYQAGAAAIWWLVGQFLGGNTHDPVDVFRATKKAHARGDNPVVCVSENWDFSGKPHCVMPSAWDDSAKPWKMTIRDPNEPHAAREITVDPDKNEFTYGSYHGGAWKGGRMYYYPYSVLNERPRTPMAEIVMLLLTGCVIFVGDTAETESLTDQAGVDLDAFGADAVARLKAGLPIDDKLMSFKGFGGEGPGTQMYLGVQPRPRFRVRDDLRLVSGMTFGELSRAGALPVALQPLTRDARRVRNLADRPIRSIVNDGEMMAALGPAAAVALRAMVDRRAVGGNIRHTLKGKQAGQLDYAIKTLRTACHVSSPLALGESVALSIDDLGTPSCVVKLKSTSPKPVKFEVTSMLGRNDDSIKIEVANLAPDPRDGVRVNIKPGLGGIDILAGGGRTTNVTIQRSIAGKAVRHEYTIPFTGGLRLRPSTVGTDAELKVGKIDAIFGPLRDGAMLKPKG